jgi:hypothetical protein
MKVFTCSNCNNPLYFENNVCLNCGHTVGFDAVTLSLITLEPAGDNEQADMTNKSNHYRFCDNATHGTCNWLIPAALPDIFCRACALNRTIPELSSPQNLDRWKRIEIAKHRLVYSLLRLNLPFFPKQKDEVKPDGGGPMASSQPSGPGQRPPTNGQPLPEGLAFDFMADVSPQERIMTGHDHGVITLNIEEADEAERVRHKQDLGERYRTLLGHFRHEIGHYYWDILIRDTVALDKYRAIFGDEQIDYSEALKAYYENGAPADWSNHFISPYASSHAWEDWAETWAHYFHLMDTVETAYSFGINIKPSETRNIPGIRARINRDPYDVSDFQVILAMWIPLTFAINSLNRSMGHEDFYPFILSPQVMKKLAFIHEICRKKPALRKKK